MEQMTNANQPLPRLTVVTVVFNIVHGRRVEHLRQCIDSVLQQTHPDIEHIIVDGASTDGTLDILKEYEGKHGIRIISEPDSGIYDAMNKGLEAATGKYIAFLNSDDYWHDPRGAAYSVECLERAQAVFSYAPCRNLYDNGREAGYAMAELGSVCSAMPFCHQTMLTRVDAMRAAGGFADGEFRIAADYDMILHLLVNGAKPVYVPLTFTTFRRGGASFTQPETTIRESRKARERQLQPLMPSPILDELECGYMPEELFRTLTGLLHPAAIRSLADAYGPANMDGLRRLQRMERIVSQDCILNNVPHMGHGWRYSSLLGLPVLRTRTLKSGMRLYQVFGFLPMLGFTMQFARKRMRWYLFGLIPFLDINHRVSGTSVWKFLGIPVWRRSPRH